MPSYKPLNESQRRFKHLVHQPRGRVGFNKAEIHGGFFCTGEEVFGAFKEAGARFAPILAAMLPVIAICIGASVGALSRWGLALWLSPGAMLPWGTLAANLIGGYLIGVAIAVFQSMPQFDPVWRLLLITGFLGGLTTFSSFSAEVVNFLMEERYGLAVSTALLHVLGSLLMTLLGLKTAMFFIAGGAPLYWASGLFR
jgi:fluoride exporter